MQGQSITPQKVCIHNITAVRNCGRTLLAIPCNLTKQLRKQLKPITIGTLHLVAPPCFRPISTMSLSVVLPDLLHDFD